MKNKVLILENNWKDFGDIIKYSKKVDLEFMPHNEESFNEILLILQNEGTLTKIGKIINDNVIDLRCIVIDLKLFDNIAGTDIIKYIRNLPLKYCPYFTKYIPIIIWTNFSNEQITKTALTAGGDFYIPKPQLKLNQDNYFWEMVNGQCEKFDNLCNNFIFNKRILREHNEKPKVYIGSSKEAIEIANAVQKNLNDVAYCQIWNSDIFMQGEYTLESIERITDDFDYAVFIFNDDDKTFLRNNIGNGVSVPRDNVILEYGMFLSKLTLKNTYFIVPKNNEKIKMHIMTDLLGVKHSHYNSKAVINIGAVSALNDACNEIKQSIEYREKLV